MYTLIEPIILKNSTQPTPTTNQNIQITPQQLVNIIRQLKLQNKQQNTNALTPFYLQAAITQMMYPYLCGSGPMQQSLGPFAGTDPTQKTEDFLNAITSNMVMTAVPEQTDSPFHEAWIMK